MTIQLSRTGSCSYLRNANWPLDVRAAQKPHSFLHLLLKLFFYWRIIALQNFVVFCQTSTWISHRYTYVLSLLNPLQRCLCPNPWNCVYILSHAKRDVTEFKKVTIERLLLIIEWAQSNHMSSWKQTAFFSWSQKNAAGETRSVRRTWPVAAGCKWGQFPRGKYEKECGSPPGANISPHWQTARKQGPPSYHSEHWIRLSVWICLEADASPETSVGNMTQSTPWFQLMRC